MAVEGLETFAANLLENKNLVSLHIICENGCLHNCSLHIRATDFDLALIVNEEHLVKLYFSVFGLGKPLNENLVASLYLELLACNINNCVHKKLC